MNQTDFAEKLSITQGHLSLIETGKKPVSKKLEKRYTKLFGKKSLIDKLNAPDLAIKKRDLRRILQNTYRQRKEAVDYLFELWNGVRERKKQNKIKRREV